MDYSLRQIFLKGLERYFLPLPKLNDSQLELLVKRLEVSGFRVSVGRTIRARKGERAITIEGSGLAWSNMELLDPLAPVIPALLSVRKTKVRGNPYFSAKLTGGSYRAQLFLRMEALGTWGELRKHDLSGLTPDEAVVISSLLEGSRGEVRGVTDYPREEGRILQFGKKVYYESMIDGGEFIANLRTVERKGIRNSYVPRNSVVDVEVTRAPSVRRIAKVIGSLDEWCYISI